MEKIYKRTQNDVTATVSQRKGMDEINRAMMAGRRDVRTMSSITRTDYDIEYRDGRKVRLVLVDAPEETKSPEQPTEKRTALIQRRATGPDLMGRVVTVKEKDYVVSQIVPADRPIHVGAPKDWKPEAYVSYWSERGGMRFGATRTAGPNAKPGTVAHAIWDAVNR
ncbi:MULTISPECIES: hypothetical protein [unclassified Streptomyces]|uniref:hypothetical protein n=1 Tax=Streptomyces sp. NPDC055082 TaxID=3365718 RepID=UPI0037CE97D8